MQIQVLQDINAIQMGLITYEIDEKKLIELRLEIIKNCSYIKHVKCIGEKIYPFASEDYLFKYVNLNQNFVGQKENFDTADVAEYYDQEYDTYEYPYLVTIIEQILSGKADVIDVLRNYSIEMENEKFKFLFDEELNKYEKEKNGTDIRELDKLRSIFDKAGKIIEEKKLNRNQIKPDNYKEQLMSCIKTTSINSVIDKQTVKVLSKFIKKLD